MLAGNGTDRRLRAFLVDTDTGESSDVLVSLTYGKVVSARTLNPEHDGQMPILESGFARVDEIVKADPDWPRPWPGGVDGPQTPLDGVDGPQTPLHTQRQRRRPRDIPGERRNPGLGIAWARG